MSTELTIIAGYVVGVFLMYLYLWLSNLWSSGRDTTHVERLILAIVWPITIAYYFVYWARLLMGANEDDL